MSVLSGPSQYFLGPSRDSLLLSQRMKLPVQRELEQWVKKLKCSGSSGVGIETFQEIKVGVDPSDVVEDSTTLSPVTEKSCDIKALSDGIKNLDFREGDKCRDTSRSRLHSNDSDKTNLGNISKVEGHYENGFLSGRAKIDFDGGISIDGYFVKGILHGFARYFDERGRLIFIGNHVNGQPTGTCWKIITGGGSVVGIVNRRGKLTGSCIAYIYPDYQTALVGRFNDGIMETAKEAEVTGCFEDEAGIKIPILTCKSNVIHTKNTREMGKFGVGMNHLLGNDMLSKRLMFLT